MADVIFITGPTRSGKSRRAVEIARACGDQARGDQARDDQARDDQARDDQARDDQARDDQALGDDVVFVATYRSDPDDAEMAERVRRHRNERNAKWRTLEAPADIAQALADLRPAPSGVVIDSLVLWLGDRFDQDDSSLIAAWEHQLDRLSAAPYPVIIVGDEIGWAPVPMDKALRRFRDLAGILGQRTAARASEAWLMVAGCSVRLK